MNEIKSDPVPARSDGVFPQAKKPRLRGLDALRGVAAVCVLLHHYSVSRPGLDYAYTDAQNLFSFGRGFYGVSLFFVISGFVILMTLEAKKNVLDFVVGRFARLYPVFWVAVLISFLLCPIPESPHSLKALFANMTMIPNFLGVGYIDPVYWSLQTEVFFYVVIGAVYFFNLRRHVVLLMVLILLPMVADFHFHFSERLPYLLKKLWFVLSLGHYGHLFLAGILLYKMRQKAMGWHYALLLLCAFHVTAEQRPFWENFAANLIAIALVWGATRFKSGLLEIPPLIYLGKISYPLYLIHCSAGWVLLGVMLNKGWAVTPSVFVVTMIVLGMAGILSFCVEIPAQKKILQFYQRIFPAALSRATKGMSCAQPLALGRE